MSEEIEYPSKERERAKVNVKVSAEVNTYLHDLYNQIQYEFCEQYEDEIKDLQQKVEQLENIRKEAIEYLKKDENIISSFWKHDFRKYPDYNPFETKDEEEVRCVELYGYDDLLNILNKGSDK